MPDSSQGSTVSFGSAIANLTGWDVSPGTAQFSDVTGMTSPAIGTGANFRVVREYDCTLVDPGTVTANMFGCPPYLVNMIGSYDTVAVDFSGGSFSFQAYLQDFQVAARVGEFLEGTATFRLTGAGFNA